MRSTEQSAGIAVGGFTPNIITCVIEYHNLPPVAKYTIFLDKDRGLRYAMGAALSDNHCIRYVTALFRL